MVRDDNVVRRKPAIVAIHHLLIGGFDVHREERGIEQRRAPSILFQPLPEGAQLCRIPRQTHGDRLVSLRA